MNLFKNCMGGGKASDLVITERDAIDQSYLNTGQLLGKGASASVYKGKSKIDGSFVAIKSVKKWKLKNDEKKGLKQEIKILTRLNHPHIMKLYQTYDEPNLCYLVTEYMAGGELFHRICDKTNYSEKDAKDVCRILFQTMAYCHDQNVAHRDLKPQNILLVSPFNDLDIKIADFGFAKYAENDYSLYTRLGTPGFVAPEILKGQCYGTKVDMWSLGVIMYVLLSGYNPFVYDGSITLSIELTRRGRYDFAGAEWENISDEAITLIRNLLNVNPSKRFSAKDALNSSWIQSDIVEYKELSSTIENLKQFNARRRLKKGVLAVMATNRFSMSLQKDCSSNLLQKNSSNSRTLLTFT